VLQEIPGFIQHRAQRHWHEFQVCIQPLLLAEWKRGQQVILLRLLDAPRPGHHLTCVRLMSTVHPAGTRSRVLILCIGFAIYVRHDRNAALHTAELHEIFALSPLTVIWHTLFRPNRR